MVKVELIKRFKKIGLGEHYGVLVNNDWVIDFQNVGIDFISLQKFSCEGKFDVTKLSHNSISRNDFDSKLEKFRGFKYNLLNGNCEHWAREFVEEKFDSPQINKVVVFALASLAVFAFT